MLRLEREGIALTVCVTAGADQITDQEVAGVHLHAGLVSIGPQRDPVLGILSDRDQDNILAKFVSTNAVREVGMRELYRMNITFATLFPDLDGLARSMGYELEFHWAYNPRTMEKFHE